MGDGIVQQLPGQTGYSDFPQATRHALIADQFSHQIRRNIMAEEKRKQQDEDQPQEESQKTRPAGADSVPTSPLDNNSGDVQAYGEPSDGSGGTSGTN
jgi:hypothetical protein